MSRHPYNPFDFAYNMTPTNCSPLPFPTSYPHHRTSYIPLPPVLEDYPPTHVSITPLLGYSPQPKLDFDVRLPPSTVTDTIRHYQLTSHEWQAPATTIPIPHMWIVCNRLRRFPVRACREYVTIYDVISTLHHELCLTASYGDLDDLPWHDRDMVNATYTNRLKAIDDYVMRQQTMIDGVKKYDFLLGRTRFAGLSKMGRERDVFVLNVV
jgi:hypothetical protein